MKEVLNVSLQGFSFTIEKDAFELLESYLSELKAHYGEQEEEVVNDIEERIAELLIERGCTDGSIVQISHIDEIIKILGRPNEIEDSQRSSGSKVKKGIFRDTQNCVVAGVCSGLGAYFKIDAVWMRVIFILVALLLTTPSFFLSGFLGIHIGWFGFMVLAYLVLWLIMPEAKTISQKCAMRGEPQSVDHIHKKFAQGARNVGSEMWQAGASATGTLFSTIWKIIRFVVGVILTALGFGGIVTLGIGLMGMDMVTGVSVLSIPDFFELNIGNTLWLKIFGVLTVLLPCVGMLYAGIMLCFNVKAPKWRPGLINFVVWMVSALVFIFCAVKAFNPYYDVNTNYKQTLPVASQNDTLYVACPKVPGMERAKMNIDASRNSLGLFYLNNGERKNTSIALYPNFEVKRVGEATPKQIKVTFARFSKPTLYDEYSGDVELDDIVVVKDSLITIKPAVYSKNNKFDGKVQKVTLYVPENSVVILQDPIEHIFGKSRSYQSGIRR